ncbi:MULTISPECIES: SusC/RagA family TonB-linked outer membrane protein [Niastella]|uniref:TonB-dependent receptor n=1 Tax=Niastella soli TaxID=2821487 RepID=A0ABS3Z301_9BACT|nr:TonB-dependent receptor [Niastella soli]MBO9204543.1 TonB-dependent receptor [Niastella soli]
MRKKRLHLIIARLLLWQLSLIITCSNTVQANAQNILEKKITLSMEQVEVKKVLREIQRQTGVAFIYSSDMINLNKKVSCKLINRKLAELFTTVLTPIGIYFNVIDEKQILLYNAPAEQKKTAEKVISDATSPPLIIGGQVLNDKGLPLPGVSVMVRGASIGTTTDRDGRFTITVPYAEATIVFSFIGYQSQDVSLQGRTALAVTLKEDAQNLKDVVVVGYGTQKKMTVTGAVAAISSRELQQSPTANLTNALAGRLPGLNVNQFSGGEPGVDISDIYIRGIGTYGNARPIVIVDGVERSLNYLSADEIESFTILKDASATAVFGVRGANGVIVITTKRGKASEKATLNFKISDGVNTPIHFPEYLGSADYAMLFNEAKINDNPGVSPSTLNLFTPEQIDNLRRAKGDNSDGLGYNINYFDYAFKPGIQQDYSLTIQGGSNRARYFIMGNYFQQNGNYKHTANDAYKTQAIFKRYNFRSNIDVDITNSLYASLILGARITDRNAPGTTANRVIEIANTQPPIYPIILESNEDPGNKAYNVKFPNGMLFGTQTYRFNMLGELSKTGYLDQRDNYLDGSFIMGYKLDALTKGLKLEGMFSYDRQGGYWITRSVPTESQGYRVYPGYATFYPNEGVDVYMKGGHYTGLYGSPRRTTDNTLGNSYSRDDDVGRTYYQLKLDYVRSFGKHNVSGLMLANRSIRIKNNEVPFCYQGISGRVTYNYDQRYLAEVDMGFNGSENFAPGRRYGKFPAASLGWVASNEPFMQATQGWLDMLKIRGSYGLVGNDQAGSNPSDNRFGYLQFYNNSGDAYNFGTQNNNNPGGIRPGRLANPLLTWEKARKINMGVDMEFMNRRLTITVDLFHEHRYDIITDLSGSDKQGFPSLVGTSAPLINAGIVNNKGIDFEITWSDKIGSYFTYTVRPNFSYARNKIKYQREVARNYPWQYRTGLPVGQPFVYIFNGFINSQKEADELNQMNNGTGFQKWGTVLPGDVTYVDIDGDGQITDLNDRIPKGYPRVPEIQYGIPISCRYKSIDVSILLQGATHTSLLLGGPATYDFPLYQNDEVGKVKPMHLQRWTPETAASAKYPALHYGKYDNNKQYYSSLFLYNAQYLRLKNFEIGYYLPSKWMKRAGLQRTRLYVQGMNMITFDKLKTVDVDPETNDANGNWYPIMKVVNFGIDITL